MITSKKISDTEIEISKEKPAEIIITKYERSFIESQIKAITEQRDAYNAQRDIEIAECQSILTEMDKLEIVVKPAEEIKSEDN